MNQLFKAVVIDDEPAARRLMKSLLQELMEVASTTTGAWELIPEKIC
jgi:CheY-like chemotaxis protein